MEWRIFEMAAPEARRKQGRVWGIVDIDGFMVAEANLTEEQARNIVRKHNQEVRA